jgi:iron complex transport system substrate-binding protein
MNSRRRDCLGLGLVLGAAASLAPQIAWAHAKARWVVVDSHVVEIVAALGRRDVLVAVGGGTDHVEGLAGVPRLPGYRQTSAEPLLALGANRLLTTPERMAPQTLDQLRAAGMTIDLMDPESSPAGVTRRIRQVAKALGDEPAGEQLVARFESELAQARALVKPGSRQTRALFVLAGGGRPMVVGGIDTNPGQLIVLAGGVHAAPGLQGFKSLSPEAMIEAAPEIIITNRDGLVPRDGAPLVLQAPGAMLTPAGRAGRVISLPGEYLQGMGLLTPRAIRELREAFDKA